MPANHRNERLSEQIRAEISQMIQREIKDPRIAGLISVTEVELTDDLRYARVFVSVLGSDEERKNSLATLRRATGFFRRLLGERLSIRYIPEIEFRYDEGIERGDRVLQLLRQLASEEGERPVADVPETVEVESQSADQKPRRRARITYHNDKR